MDESLLMSAMERAVEIALYLSHNRPDGTEFSSINGKISGENFTAGDVTVSNAMENFMNSDSHKSNILTKTYSSVGIVMLQLMELIIGFSCLVHMMQ